MKTYLEYKDEKSQKFWEIEVKEKTVITRYGKIGADGRLTEKEFESKEKALKDAEKQIGYINISAFKYDNKYLDKNNCIITEKSEILYNGNYNT